MKIVFASNLYTPHQAPFCECISEEAEEFYFVETMERDSESLPVGWRFTGNLPDFVLEYKRIEEAKIYIEEADYLITGSAPEQLFRGRQKHNKITFRYAERAYRNGCPKWQIPLRYVKNHLRYHKNEYMLCASAYTAADLALTRNFIGRTYKWGYFTEVFEYDIHELMKKKRENTAPLILWVGRLIELKHPDTAIQVARRLKDNGYKFELQLIGTGELENSLQALVKEIGVEDCVRIVGAISQKQVRKYMERANIFLFTSDFNEGWGAVLSESMSSGCAVVASHAIGAVPFLVENGKNGLVYKNGDIESLNKKVSQLLDNAEYCENLGMEAYAVMRDLWNPQVAARRFVEFAEEIGQRGACDLFESGPCSRAEIIKNDWIDEDA